VTFDLTALLASPTPSWPSRVLIGLGVVVLTALLRVMLDVIVPGLVPYALMFPAVLLATAVGGWQAGAITLGTALTLAWYAILPPRWSWEVKSAADIVGILLVGVSGALILAFTEALRRTTRRLVEERARQGLLNNELNHRVKNTLASVQSIAVQTFGKDDSARAARRVFEDRLLALSRAHDVLTRTAWTAADLGEVVDRAMAPFADRGQITWQGPEIPLASQPAIAISMALHELATNAMKYGALSVPAGRVAIAWEHPDARLRLHWRETGGPPVEPPAHEGFGLRLLKRGLAGELGGSVEMTFAHSGLVCDIDAPLRDV
jgi:two-component sensor histidine kinase